MNNSIELFKDLFKNFIIGLVVLNENNEIIHSNKSFQNMVKYSKNEILNSNFINYISLKDRDEYLTYFNNLKTGKINSFKIDIRYLTKYKKNKWWNIKVNSTYDDSNKKFIFVILDDITLEKIKNQNLKISKELAEKTIKVKSEFFANMSHEIRTPIQTIIGMNELLLETNLDAEQQEYCEQIRFSTNVIINLVNDILDFSKIEAGKLQLEVIDFNFHKLIEDAVKLVVLDAHKKGLEICVNIEKDIPCFLQGDPVRIRQIITNLVNNAVKFTDKGEIEILVKLIQFKDNKYKIKINVRDTGLGIPENQLKKLFRAFSQVNSSTTRIYGGTGLGLSISKNLVKLMNGKIGVISKNMRGSTFWFTVLLDMSKVEKDEMQNKKNKYDEVNILLVDDNKTARKITKKYLEEFGCVVKEVNDGQEALKILMETATKNKKEFDYCLIDLIMPGMDGWQLASEINNNNYIKLTKLILLCPLGRSAEEAKMKLLKWFDGYIYKPIRREDINNLLKKAIKNKFEPLELEELSPYIEEEDTSDIRGDNKTVLVADDHVVNQRLFKINLENLGFKVLIVDDGIQAVKKTSQDIDIIFMDLHMPNLKGYDATKKIREKGFTRPIIAVTATTSKIERDKCLKSGMDDFLPKPFKKNDLIFMLKKWLSNSKKDNNLDINADNSIYDDKEIFNFEKAVKNFIGNKDVVIDLLDVYKDKLNNQLLLLKEALKKNDLNKISQIAHSIKGSSLTLEINKIGIQAKLLEQYANDGLKEKSEDSIFIIEEEFDKLKKVIEKITKVK